MDDQRAKLEAQIADLKQRRDSTSDSKVKKRLNQQAKAKQRKLDDLNQRPAGMRIGIDPKGGSKKRIPTQPDMQLHHGGSSLNNARAFFEGLDTAEKLLMEREFAKRGIVPGDVTMNALAMLTDQHQAGIHKIERDLKLEGKQYFKPGATFQEKLKAVDAFAADQRTLQKLAEEMTFSGVEETGGLSRRVLATATPEQSQEYADIERKRRTETAKDIKEYGPETHRVASTQTEPDVDFDILRHYRNGIKTPPTAKPKPKPKPKSKPKKSRVLGFFGSAVASQFNERFNPSPGFGTNLGGAREISDLEFPIMLP